MAVSRRVTSLVSGLLRHGYPYRYGRTVCDAMGVSERSWNRQKGLFIRASILLLIMSLILESPFILPIPKDKDPLVYVPDIIEDFVPSDCVVVTPHIYRLKVATFMNIVSLDGFLYE